ncbi:MAG TPA: general secretion pathway protein GspK [Desulfobacterales bacterium]|jgi:general secretion pathway protein K|nr:general secretion pathway protein GspK [Desulfobacterales bacterium]
MGRFLRNNRGMALILTILIISLIVALTLQFNTSMRSHLHAASNLRDGIKLGYVAKSGFNRALALLLLDVSEGDADSLHEAWADPKALSGNSAAQFDHGRFEVKVSDHSGRIQINKLLKEDGKNYNEDQKGLLTRFLESEDFELEREDVDNIVNAIKDWIDEDDDPTGLGGAENSYYQGLETAYSCKNAPVEFLEELQYVRWIRENKELYKRISPYVTPHGNDGKINLNTAHRLVLRALSDETTEAPEMVDSMIEYRNDEDNNLKEINWDDRVGMKGVNYSPGLLTTTSTYFEITSRGFRGTLAKQVTGMVKRKGDGLSILSWKID